MKLRIIIFVSFLLASFLSGQQVIRKTTESVFVVDMNGDMIPDSIMVKFDPKDDVFSWDFYLETPFGTYSKDAFFSPQYTSIIVRKTNDHGVYKDMVILETPSGGNCGNIVIVFIERNGKIFPLEVPGCGGMDMFFNELIFLFWQDGLEGPSHAESPNIPMFYKVNLNPNIPIIEDVTGQFTTKNFVAFKLQTGYYLELIQNWSKKLERTKADLTSATGSKSKKLLEKNIEECRKEINRFKSKIDELIWSPEP